MKIYGKIVNGELITITSNQPVTGYKEVRYEDTMALEDSGAFDPATQYVTAGVPVDEGEYIFVPAIIHDVVSA